MMLDLLLDVSAYSGGAWHAKAEFLSG